MRALLLLTITCMSLAGCTEPIAAIEPESKPADPILIFDRQVSGMLPGPEADSVVTQSIPIPVSETATKIVATHNATYTGLWPSVIALYPPGAEEPSAQTLDYCTPIIEVHTGSKWNCIVDVTKVETFGEWTLEHWWQIGEGYEEYTITIEVYGQPDPESPGRNAERVHRLQHHAMV